MEGQQQSPHIGFRMLANQFYPLPFRFLCSPGLAGVVP